MGKKFIPLCRPWIGEEEITAVGEVIASRWLSTGPKVAEFEKKFAEYVGSKHAIAVSSCTAAIHLSLVVAGVSADNEVITTPYTFTATAEAIGYIGAKPIFVDIDPHTLNIDVSKIEAKITPRTKAIVPVHIAGSPCEMADLIAICDRHNLALIDDAAHAVTTEIDGKRIGNLGDLSAFSFYATKNLAIGEGGMITTNRDDLVDQLKSQRLHGINKDAWSRQQRRNVWSYEIANHGFKYNMTDIQAAIGLCQLSKIEKQLEMRQKFAKIYADGFAELPEIQTPIEPKNGRHAWHLYIVQLDQDRLKIDRDNFINEMRKEKIECGVHYIPLHFFEFYQKKYGYEIGDFPIAETVFDRVVTLPLHAVLETEDLHTVVRTVKKIIR